MAFDAFLRGSTATTAMGRDATRTCSSPRPTLGGIRAQRRGVACAGGNGSARVSWLFPVTGRITANCSPAGSPGEFRVSAVCDSSRICPRREKRTNRECDCDDDSDADFQHPIVGDDRIRSPHRSFFLELTSPSRTSVARARGGVHLRVGVSRRRNPSTTMAGDPDPFDMLKPIKPKSAAERGERRGKAETLEEILRLAGAATSRRRRRKKTEGVARTDQRDCRYVTRSTRRPPRTPKRASPPLGTRPLTVFWLGLAKVPRQIRWSPSGESDSPHPSPRRYAQVVT